MIKYESFHPANEIKGQIMLAFLYCTEREDIMPVLQKHNLTNIQPDQWYPEQPWVDVLNDLVEAGNAMFDFVSIGMKMADLVPFPIKGEAIPFKDMILAWGESGANGDTYRGPDYGWRHVEMIDDYHAEVTYRYASPDDMMYGFIYGYCRRIFPKGVPFTVTYREGIQRCDQGGEQTVVDVQWGKA